PPQEIFDVYVASQFFPAHPALGPGATPAGVLRYCVAVFQGMGFCPRMSGVPGPVVRARRGLHLCQVPAVEGYDLQPNAMMPLAVRPAALSHGRGIFEIAV